MFSEMAVALEVAEGWLVANCETRGPWNCIRAPNRMMLSSAGTDEAGFELSQAARRVRLIGEDTGIDRKGQLQVHRAELNGRGESRDGHVTLSSLVGSRLP